MGVGSSIRGWEFSKTGANWILRVLEHDEKNQECRDVLEYFTGSILTHFE